MRATYHFIRWHRVIFFQKKSYFKIGTPGAPGPIILLAAFFSSQALFLTAQTSRQRIKSAEIKKRMR